MTRHLTDEELLELLTPGVTPTERAREHLASCAACRDRVEAERPLADRLAALPREMDTRRDLWPSLADRLREEPRALSTPPWWRGRAALQAAAAAAIFVLGALAGRGVGTGDDDPIAFTEAGDPLATAAEVQRAGTAYVAAVARFRQVAAGSPAPLVDQARDVALATVHGAAWELARLRPGDATAHEIVELAGQRRLAVEVP